MEHEIRLMRRSDVVQIARMEKSIFPDPWPEDAFHEILGSDDWGGIVSLESQKPIGYGIFNIVLDELHLTNIAVDKSYRQKGVATQLLGRIFELAKLKKCQTIILEVRPSNSPAIAFYEKNGFATLYVRPRYYQHPVEDALVMSRNMESQ